MNLQEEVEEWYQEHEEYEVLIASKVLDEIHIRDVVEQDEILRLLSLLFLLIYLYRFTHSAFLAVSFFLTIILAADSLLSVLQDHYRYSFHINVLLLGLQTIMGVIDVFVFMESWRLSKRICPPVSKLEAQANQINRMDFTLIYYGSKTTEIVFSQVVVFGLLAMTEDLGPYKSLTIYAEMLLVFIRLTILLVLPPAMIIYEGQILPLLPKCFKKKYVQPIRQSPLPPPIEEEEHNCQETIDEYFQRFFQYLAQSPNGKIIRYIVIIGAFVWTLVCIIAAFELNNAAESDLQFQNQFIPKDSWEMRANKYNKMHFNQIEDNAEIDIVFGVTGFEFEERHEELWQIWWPEEIGRVKLDKKFNMTSIESQRYLLNLCNLLSNKHALVYKNNTACWIQDFQKFVTNVQNGIFPVQNSQMFLNLIDEWVNKTEEGKEHWKDGRIFKMDGQIVGCRITVITDVKQHDVSRIKKPAYERW